MICIILAAGKGTRLQPVTNSIPKPLLKINEKPILAYTIENLPDAVTRVVVVVKHLSQLIKAYFGKQWAGKKITYVDALTLKGTADMVRQAKKFVKGKTLILYGDDLYKKEDLKRLIEETGPDEWSILAKEVKNPKGVGVFKFSKEGKVEKIVEHPQDPPSNLVNTGAYIIDQRFFTYRQIKIPNGEYGLPQTILQASKEIPILVIKASFWFPVNTKEDYEIATEALKKKSSYPLSSICIYPR